MPDTAPPPPPTFLDVPLLLERSRPQSGSGGLWYLGGLVAIVVASVGLSGNRAPGAQVASFVLFIALVGGSMLSSILRVRRHRAQAQAVEAIEEMVQLRRWQPAGMMLDRFLSEPVAAPTTWTRALVQLASILGRHHRFAEAIVVQDFLIDHELLDDISDYGVRVGRAMAMLREDDLVDADRAIGDLRKRGPARESGPLALLEIYRDVKTGHPAEAIELFDQRLPVMRQQLGHRVADAHALVARAYDLLGRADEARGAYGRATRLAPPAELQRRYPELAALAGKYEPAPAPPEAP